MAAVYPNQLAQSLKNRPAVVLLWGDDAGALRQAQAQVVASTGIDPADPFAADKIGFSDIVDNPARLIDAATTLAFGASSKLVVVTGVSGNEDAAAVKNFSEAVTAMLQFNLADVTVVMALPGLLSKTSALVKAVESAANGLSVRFFTDSARDLTGFLQGALSAAGVAMDGDAQAVFAAGLGADREIAAREVEKLLLYVNGAPRITLADVQESLSGAPRVDAFILADAVAARNPAEADRLIQILLAEGDTLESAFHAVTRHLNQLALAQTMQAEGADTTTILAQTGKMKSPKDAQTRFLQQVRAYPAGRLKTLPQYSFTTLAAARKYGATAPLTLARAMLALAA